MIAAVNTGAVLDSAASHRHTKDELLCFAWRCQPWMIDSATAFSSIVIQSDRVSKSAL